MTERERDRDDDTDIEELEGIEFDDEELGPTERRSGEEADQSTAASPLRDAGNDE